MSQSSTGMYSLSPELTLNIKAFYVEIHNFLCLSISEKFPGAKVFKFVTLLGPVSRVMILDPFVVVKSIIVGTHSEVLD